jgi:hypothetical protein
MDMQPPRLADNSSAQAFRLMESPLSAFSDDRLSLYFGARRPELSSKPEKSAMSVRWASCVICLGCAAYLATEALPRPVLPPLALPATARDEFSGEPKATAIASGYGDRLLNDALARLKGATSLRLTIWQRVHGEAGFEAEARVVLAPRQCARMDMTITAGASTLEQKVISDGQALACISVRDGKETVRGHSLPASRAVREHLLSSHGCVGPAPFIKRIKHAVPSWTVNRATMNERPLLRLTGPIDETVAQQLGAAGASWCQVTLDADSLWPMRVELRRETEAGRRPAFEIEFRAPELDPALSPDECARLFTYRPRHKNLR